MMQCAPSPHSKLPLLPLGKTQHSSHIHKSVSPLRSARPCLFPAGVVIRLEFIIQKWLQALSQGLIRLFGFNALGGCASAYVCALGLECGGKRLTCSFWSRNIWLKKNQQQNKTPGEQAVCLIVISAQFVNLKALWSLQPSPPTTLSALLKLTKQQIETFCIPNRLKDKARKAELAKVELIGRAGSAKKRKVFFDGLISCTYSFSDMKHRRCDCCSQALLLVLSVVLKGFLQQRQEGPVKVKWLPYQQNVPSKNFDQCKHKCWMINTECVCVFRGGEEKGARGRGHSTHSNAITLQID